MVEPARFPTLTQQLFQLASGSVTSDDLVRRSLDAITASQPALNAFRVVLTDQALADAAEADRKRAAGKHLPLLGIPIAVKDDVDIKGVPTRFGTDGTINGAVDGKVPLTNVLSDAANETFTVGTYQGSPCILVTKQLGTVILGVSTYPSRSLTLRINLETGQTYFSVDHYDTALTYWTCTRTFTRSPRTIMRGVSEFAVSTAVSNPYNAITNPGGLSEPNVIRVTVGTSDAPKNEASEWLHHTDTFQIKARN